MKKLLLYFIIALFFVGCSGSYGASDIMDCFGKNIEINGECEE